MKGYKKVCMYQIVKRRTKRRSASFRRRTRNSKRRQTGRRKASYPMQMGQYYEYI